MPLFSDADVSDIESATDGEGNHVPIANDGTYSAVVADAAIDATGTLIELDTRGKTILDLALSGTNEADYELEASPTGEPGDWFGPFDSWTNAAEIIETYRIGARYVRIKVTTAASGGSTADGFAEVS